MKKNFKLLFLLLCIFTFALTIYAEEDTADVVPDSNDKVGVQKEAIDKYCSENANLGGCLYDKNDPLYTTIKGGKRMLPTAILVNSRPYTATFRNMPDLTVKRAYQTFDGNGNAVYAACFRYDYPQSEFDEEKLPGLSAGSYFFFTTITENKKGKCVKREYVIPAEGNMAYSYIKQGLFSSKYKIDRQHEYDGQEDVEGFKLITFNGWKAKDKGDCPKVFGYTANTEWYTSSANKYIFSENASDFNIKTFSFFGNEQYVARPGCTVEDKDGKAVTEELLKEIKKEIEAYACPAKIEDMVTLSNELEGYYNKLREDNEYRVLWSAGLIDEVTRNTAQNTIRGYIKEKMTSCQYKICNISSTEKTKINNNMGSTCKNGCSLSNVSEQSSDPNAKCYCCGGSQGCTYKWMVETSGAQCSLQSSMTKDQCLGTTKDLECRKCLETAYNAAGLSNDKKSCLMSNEILKSLTENDLIDDNKDEADKDAKEEIEDNKELREEIFKGLTIKAPDWNLSDKPMTCAEILGPNLMKIVSFAITTLRIVGSIMAIVLGMMKLIPAVTKGDQSELKSALTMCIWMAAILIIIVVLPILLRTIGNLFGIDTTCIP